MKFLTETVENVQVDIQESALGVKDYYITGIFMQSGIKNKNGRIYPADVLAREMNRYSQDQIKNKRSVGELNHPSGPNINLDKVSHMITELWVEGQNIYGKAKILNTPQGQIVKTLIDEGVQLGVSTRGFGSVKESNGVKMVQSDFRLATIDIVQDPSCQSAYVSTLMESKEFFVDDAGNIRERDPSIVVESVDVPESESQVAITEEDEAKWEAGEFKDKATKAKSAGDIAGYHAHMIGHHKAMRDWYDQKGNESSADEHDEKASAHKKKLSKLNEDVMLERFESALNEISKATLGSYVKKASKDVETKTTDSASFTAAAERRLDIASDLDKHMKFKDSNAHRKAADQFYKYSDKDAAKVNKRQKGIAKAVDKLTEDTLSEAVQIDHSSYMASHGSQARGNGSWIVSKHKHVDFDKHVEGVDYHQGNGKLTDVVREAAKKLKAKVLYPQP